MQHLLRAISRLTDGQSITCGSGEAADIRLTGHRIDPVHVRLMRRQGEIKVQDLNSEAGTFVNGIEVRGLVPVRAGDMLRIGSLELQIDGAFAVTAAPAVTPSMPVPAVEPRASTGISITLDGVTVTVTTGGLLARHKKEILKDVDIHVAPGQFVGILGASGSGKSTLIKTIAGLVSASDGRILLDGQVANSYDLQKNRRIAYMPQDVVIHEQITTRRALGYIAALKGEGGSRRKLANLVAGVAQHTGLTDRLDIPIHRLSGGQRKRAALAAELIGDPRLILLDEATSGLDPATEGEMMRLFRSLADEGRTVICITHFPNRLALCDRLIYLMDGQVVFAGPPIELQKLFGTGSIEEVYLTQGSRGAEEWRREYDTSLTGQASARELGAAISAAARRRSIAAVDSQSGGAAQFVTLLRRYFALQRADWTNLLLLFLQAPAIALMIASSFGSIRADFCEVHAADTKEVIFLLVIAMLWCSGMVAVREIVKEQSIVRHEVRFGLRLLPYLLSKLVLLSLFAVAQAAVLLWMVGYFTELTGGFLIQLSVIAVTSTVGLALGLLVSAASGSSERAMTILPVVLIMQAIFSGGISMPEGIVKVISEATVPAYWALDGMRSTFSTCLTYATYPNAPGHFQPPILGRGGPLWLDLLALVGHGAIFSVFAYFVLNKKFLGWRHSRD